jgi:predicted amidohydrolase YtcJ
MVDGVLSTRTALMKAPYDDNAKANPDAIMNEDILLRYVNESHENGFPVAIHAIGDRAVQMALDAFEKAGHPEGMLPDRVEHIEVVTPDDVERFKFLGVVASMQPIHATCCVGDYVISRIGEERMPNAYAWRRMLDNGIQLSLSSDWPTSPLNPLEHIASAMKRETKIDGTMGRCEPGPDVCRSALCLYSINR